MRPHARLSLRHPSRLKFGPLELIDIPDLVAACTDQWYNQTLCRVNEAVVRDDEFFHVVSGRLWIDLEGGPSSPGPARER